MHHSGILCPPWGLSLIDDFKAHLFNHRQVIIEGAARLRCHSHRIAGQSVIACSPMARTASHRHARQQQWLPMLCCSLNTFGYDHSWGWHDHLEAVLNGFATLEEENILGAGANING